MAVRPLAKPSMQQPQREGGARIVEPGRNAWCVERADKVAFLVDAADYFAAFAAACRRARESILIIGWDVQESTPLFPGAAEAERRSLGEFLDDLCRQRRDLRIDVLDWNFSLVFALERELLPEWRPGWRRNRRLRFRLDAEHPLGGCHHQKIVVVDDAVAFLGGLDLTTSRWDTSDHAADDPRRCGPDGKPYAPFHDVQVAVSGPVAAKLGSLCRERWRRAVGRVPRAPRRPADPWPPELRPDLTHVDVALARTEPAYAGRPEVREVEQLFQDTIAAARATLYVENQYLTSVTISDALARALEDPDGPEIVLVVPRTCSGWLEEGTMGVLRGRLLRRLRAADRHGRLYAYAPCVPGPDGRVFPNVHSKVMIADDALLRIGSANLSNRSMGMDTECDLALESQGDPEVATTIVGFRDRLLAEHLGVTTAALADAVRAEGSVGRAVERLRGGPRTLVPLADADPGWLDETLPTTVFPDLERPVADVAPLAESLPPGLREPALRTVLRGAGVLAVLLGLAALWSFTGLREAIVPSELARWLAPLRDTAAGPFVVLGAFAVAATFLVPVTALITATVLLYGPAVGAPLALAGSLIAAVAAYTIGRLLWKDTVRRLTGPALSRVGRHLARAGTGSVAAVRLVPIAPYTVVGVVAGALQVRFLPYLAGTALGLLPGILGLSLFADLLAG
jgi:phospholipase D1/2